MYTVEGDGAIIFGGMYARVIRGLDAMNMEYDVHDHRTPIPEALWGNIQHPLRDKQDYALAAIATNHNGVIHAATGFGKTHLICQLCRMYPDSNILIISPRKQVVSDIFKRASDAALEGSIITKCDGTRTFREDSNAVVCTTGSLHKIPSAWPDMVLFDEVHGAATDRIKDILIEFEGPRMYGFSASPTGRGDGADMEITGLFGEVICAVSYQEAEAAGNVAPIEVRIVPVVADEVTATTDVTKQRRGYWRNRVRNNAVAKAALSFKETEQVLVIVKTAEHALFLRRLLPDFSIVHAGISKEKWKTFVKLGLCTDEEYDSIGKIDTDAMKQAYKEGSLLKVIATTTWKEGVDFPLLAGLVRADGMAGSIPAIQIGGRLSRGDVQKVLYDFDDDYGDSFKRRSKGRIRTYKKNGWVINDWPA
jgi:superfamily II DNA or RNA helicase